MSPMPGPPDFSSARRIRAGIDRAMEDAVSGRIVDVLRVEGGDPRGEVYVVRLLESAPGIGKVAARRIAAELGHDGFTRVSELSAGEREDLVSTLGGSA